MVENYNYIQGRRHTEADLGGAVFVDTIGYWLGGILGDITTTGATPYTNTFSVLNATSGDAQPKSFTLTDYYVAGNRYYPGCQVHDFTMTFNADGQLEYTTKVTGFPSQTTAAVTPSFSDVVPTAVWRGTVSIGGSTIGYTTAGTITMTRKIDPIFGINTSQGPYEVFLGALDTTANLTFVMENDDALVAFLDNQQPALEFNWSQGSGASETNIGFTLSKDAWTTAAIDRSGDHVAITVDVSGLGNVTDAGASGGYGLIQWTLINTVDGEATYQ
jgi:hypothetical protein